MSRWHDNVVRVKSFLIVFPNDFLAKYDATKILSSSVKNNCEYTNIYESGIKVTINTRKPVEFNSIKKQKFSLLTGDDFELGDMNKDECMGHAALICVDIESGICEILTSITGLPPIFYYKDRNKTIFATDIFLLKDEVEESLEFKAESILDLCRVGHTTNNKTLFNDLIMLQAGHKITWKNGNDLKIEKKWELPKTSFEYDWDQYCELQIEKFNNAVDKIDLTNVFLSLTGGLDTRAIFSSISSRNKDISAAYTVSGFPLSLDARIARKLCNHYGIKHYPIILDEGFLRSFEDLSLEASRLSGGIYSIEQAHEVFFCKSVDALFQGRLSGNMGNQIGRGGTEGVSMRNGDATILATEFLASFGEKKTSDHWFHNMKKSAGNLEFISLLQDEIPNSSVGNYCIGNYYFAQKSPYAHRSLIEMAVFKPKWTEEQSLSLMKMRIDDIKHRVFGEREEKSFQRRLINRNGGFAASCSINWGWRAKGGLSLSGSILGVGAILDSAIVKMRTANPAIKHMSTILGVTNLQAYKHCDSWTKEYLKNFVWESIMAKTMKEYFDREKTEKVLKEFFDQGNMEKYNTVCFALDIALANLVFRQKI